jgi:hypothetical protein
MTASINSAVEASDRRQPPHTRNFPDDPHPNTRTHPNTRMDMLVVKRRGYCHAGTPGYREYPGVSSSIFPTSIRRLVTRSDDFEGFWGTITLKASGGQLLWRLLEDRENAILHARFLGQFGRQVVHVIQLKIHSGRSPSSCNYGFCKNHGWTCCVFFYEWLYFSKTQFKPWIQSLLHMSLTSKIMLSKNWLLTFLFFIF